MFQFEKDQWCSTKRNDLHIVLVPKKYVLQYTKTEKQYLLVGNYELGNLRMFIFDDRNMYQGLSLNMI